MYLTANTKQVTSFAFVALAGLIRQTHTPAGLAVSYLCIILTPTHQTQSSHIPVSYYRRQCITIYIGLCNCVLSKLKTDNIPLLNLTHIFFRALCGRQVKREGNFLHLVRYFVLINITVFLYVTPCSLVEKHQHFTDTFASNNAEDEGSMLACNGTSLPDYTVLQPTRQRSSLILFLNLKSMESHITVCTYNDHILRYSSIGTALCHCYL